MNILRNMSQHGKENLGNLCEINGKPEQDVESIITFIARVQE